MTQPTHRIAALDRAGFVTSLGLGLVICLLAFSQALVFFHDDAFITLRYAQNFLAGHGFVWNAGERVEGYTNFLHMLIVTGLGSLGMDLQAAARGSCTVWFIMLLGFVAWQLRSSTITRSSSGPSAAWSRRCRRCCAPSASGC